MRIRSGFAGTCLVAAALAVSCARKTPAPVAGQPTPASAAAPGRNPKWAVPVEKPGLPNLHKVSDALYRGAQPEGKGFAELKALGVKTVVNLRLLHSDRDEMKEAGLKAGEDFKYVHIRMEAWDADKDELVEFLEVLADPANRPVFVHCKHGADRTGTAVATYRIVCQGWTKEDAIDEMRNGGFNFHEIWKGLPKFLREMDVAKLREDAGLGE
ncbi:MAG: dual specificity protein phosphatase family protein [Planctomycetota bacterium]|jgi:protein tyrosine/serine phosphatase